MYGVVAFFVVAMRKMAVRQQEFIRAELELEQL